MQLLKTDFIAKGTVYKQIARNDKAAIYEIRRVKGTNKGYEVFKIRVAKAHTWPNGNHTPEHESYPGDEQFGKIAWYFMELNGAQKRFEEISK
jgi:hypothetical protein